MIRHNFCKMILIIILLYGCGKDFLDEKPNSEIVVPKSLIDLQALLENYSIMNLTGSLAQVSSDEYIIPDYSSYLSLKDMTAQNAYIWQKDLYEGETNILDWNDIYKSVFYANNVLKELNLNNHNDLAAKNNLVGWALFSRSFAFYNLVSNFSPIYNAGTADIDLGIPLRTQPEIDYTNQRASVQMTYNQIISDLNKSLPLLSNDVNILNPNRPSKAAVHALLSRIYLYMGDYQQAENSADNCLNIYSKLIDFNNVSTTSTNPIGNTSDETLFYSLQAASFSELTYSYGSSPRPYSVNEDLIMTYEDNDLRKKIFYIKTSNGTYNSKRRYTTASNPFTGLTTSEMYLIKAECLARRNEVNAAMHYLDLLLTKRYKINTYVNLIANSKDEALDIVLLERRKELAWRGIRWSDIKRLNKEGKSIILTRKLDSTTYRLPPNDSRYIFPIPSDEILLSGIKQNQR